MIYKKIFIFCSHPQDEHSFTADGLPQDLRQHCPLQPGPQARKDSQMFSLAALPSGNDSQIFRSAALPSVGKILKYSAWRRRRLSERFTNVPLGGAPVCRNDSHIFRLAALLSFGIRKE